MVYDWRVGTSICEMLKRASSTPIASGSVGISGTSISSTFDGMCVKTIVLISPKRARHPRRRQRREPGQQVGAEEDRAQQRRRPRRSARANQ